MVLWWINVGLAMAVTALLPFFFFSNPTFGSSLEGLTAIWLVPIFPCVVASGVGGIIATQVSQGVGAACSVPGTLPHAPQPHTHPHTCRPPQELQRASSTWATSCGAWVCPSASPSSPSTTSACCPTAYRHGSSLCPASCRWMSARAGVVPLPGWHRCGRKGSLPSAPLNPVPTLHRSPHGRRCHGGNHSGAAMVRSFPPPSTKELMGAWRTGDMSAQSEQWRELLNEVTWRWPATGHLHLRRCSATVPAAAAAMLQGAQLPGPQRLPGCPPGPLLAAGVRVFSGGWGHCIRQHCGGGAVGCGPWWLLVAIASAIRTAHDLPFNIGEQRGGRTKVVVAVVPLAAARPAWHQACIMPPAPRVLTRSPPPDLSLARFE